MCDFFLVNIHVLNTYQLFLFETIVQTIKKVYEFAAIPVLISEKFFFRISVQSAPFANREQGWHGKYWKPIES